MQTEVTTKKNGVSIVRRNDRMDANGDWVEEFAKVRVVCFGRRWKRRDAPLERAVKTHESRKYSHARCENVDGNSQRASSRENTIVRERLIFYCSLFIIIYLFSIKDEQPRNVVSYDND